MRSVLLAIVAVNLFSINVHADFTAPSIDGASIIVSPSVGSIIFDTSLNTFRGYASTGAWQTLSQTPSVVSVTAAYNVGATDDVVLASGSNYSVVLPDATAAANKKFFRIKKTDTTLSAAVDVTTTSSQTIALGTSSPTFVPLQLQGETLTMVSDGSNWQVVDYACPPIVAVASGLVAGTYTASTPLQFNTVQIDTLSAITTGSSWKYTVARAGYYSVSIGGQQPSAGASNVDFGIYKNGTVSYSSTKNSSVGSFGANTYQSFWGGGHAIVSLAKGDYIDVRPTSSVPVGSGGVITITYLKPL